MKVMFIMSREELNEIDRVQKIYAEKLNIDTKKFTECARFTYLDDMVKVSYDFDSKYTMYWCEIYDALSDKIIAIYDVMKQFGFLAKGLIEEFKKKVREIKERNARN